MNTKFLALCLLTASSISFASDKYYGEFSFGKTNQTSESSSNRFPVDSQSLGIVVGMNLNQYFAVEGSYVDYGKDDRVIGGSSGFVESLQSESLGVGIKAILPVTDQFSIYARSGIAQWSWTYKVKDLEFPEMTASIKDSGSSWYQGVGLKLEVSDDIGVGLNYTNLSPDVRDEVGGVINHEIENISLAISISF
ncbi:MAG: outer membrane beta-barrel protein [Gammaproteobacteria bacterium]|nr:outer membrane beta-barrel protein [Gammaproteobacteria bacterium]